MNYLNWCLLTLQGKQNADYIKGLSVIGVQQIDRVVEVVEESLKGNSVRMFGSKRAEGKKVGGAKLDLPKIRRNPLVEIIAINTGKVFLDIIIYESYNSKDLLFDNEFWCLR